MSGEHERLLQLMVCKPEDYKPWGDVERWEDPKQSYPDCSCDCKFARWLEDTKDEYLSMDWCVCTNPKSHRAGLLTFEHQGCQAYEPDPDAEAEEAAEAEAALPDDLPDPTAHWLLNADKVEAEGVVEEFRKLLSDPESSGTKEPK